MAPDLSPQVAPDRVSLLDPRPNRTLPSVDVASRASASLAFAFAHSPAYLNEPNETARPRDERTAYEFETRGRLPRLDEVEAAEWSRDRWRE